MVVRYLRMEVQMSTVTSKDFNRNPTSVKRQADRGPVYITERGRIAYVVVSIESYRRLRAAPADDLVSFLQSDEPDDYELPAVSVEIPGAVL